jgi:hypothetical protein
MKAPIKYFKPTDPNATIDAYGKGMCSAKSPIGLTGGWLAKAKLSKEFTEVVKTAKKKATKKV